MAYPFDMKSSRLPWWYGMTLVFLVITSVAPGHQDPLGDIHPQVSVVDGRFSVVFNTSIPDEPSDYLDTRPVYRMIFEKDGRMFAPRHPLAKRRPHWETGPVGLYGKPIRLGDSMLYFGETGGAPQSYLLRNKEGKLRRVRLAWPKNITLQLLEGVTATDEGIAMTGKEDREILKFYWFAHDSVGEPKILTIGATACIYDFPVASNITFADGRYWVAFMRPDEEALKLSMWSWKPGEEKGRVEDLDSPANWNSHLSMAAIGDQLCLAYHLADRYPGVARIVTVFHKAE